MEATYNFQPKQSDLSKFFVHANDIIPMNEAVISQGETRMFSIGDISVITGQPKSRKNLNRIECLHITSNRKLPILGGKCRIYLS